MQARWHGRIFIDVIEANAKTERDGRILSGYRDEIAHARGTIPMGAAHGAIMVGIEGVHVG